MTASQPLVAARKRPAQARSRALVDTILDTTARILVEDGLARTTTNRVAERAGVSIGSLYQYFPSREALIAAVAHRHSERLKRTLQAALDGGAADLRAGLAAMLQAIVQAHRVAPELTAVLNEEVGRFGELDWQAESMRHGVALARQVIDRHADEVRRDLDRDAAAFVCATCVHGVMNVAARQRPTLIRDGSIAREMLALLLGYLTSGGGT